MFSFSQKIESNRNCIVNYTSLPKMILCSGLQGVTSIIDVEKLKSGGTDKSGKPTYE